MKNRACLENGAAEKVGRTDRRSYPTIKGELFLDGNIPSLRNMHVCENGGGERTHRASIRSVMPVSWGLGSSCRV